MSTRIRPIKAFERNHSDSFIIRSVPKAINTMKMLFQGIENPHVQLIEDGVKKFPIDTAGNRIDTDINIRLKISLPFTG